MNVHEVYNLLLINHNEITSKENFTILKQTLRIKDENVIINDFNLHHFL